MACLVPAAPLEEAEKASSREIADQVDLQADALVQQLAAIDQAASAAATIAAEGTLSLSIPGASDAEPSQHSLPAHPNRKLFRI